MGDSIILLGRNIIRTQLIACRFDNTWGPYARFINETAVECTPPSLPGLAHGDLVSLSLTLNGLNAVDVNTSTGIEFTTSVRVVGVPLPTSLAP